MKIEKTFNQRHNDCDEWYTPASAVEIIVPFLKEKGFKNILCPFDKEESNFVRILNKHGFNVTFSHIDTGTDFFEIDNLSDYDAIVSNPPYSKRQQIIERLYDSNVPFAMIMNFNGLFDNRKRWILFKEKGVQLLIPCGRIAFFNQEHKASPPMFQSVFLCSGVLHKQIEFSEIGYEQLSIL